MGNEVEKCCQEKEKELSRSSRKMPVPVEPNIKTKAGNGQDGNYNETMSYPEKPTSGGDENIS